MFTIGEVEEIIGFKKDYIYRNIKIGNFPAQIKIGTKSSRWSLNEVISWLEDQKKNSAA